MPVFTLCLPGAMAGGGAPVTMEQTVDQFQGDAGRLWRVVCRRLADSLEPGELATWFRPLYCQLEDGAVVLHAPNHFFGEWIRERYQRQLDQALAEAMGGSPRVVFEVASGEVGPEPADPPGRVEAPRSEEAFEHQLQLNPRYSFDTFVVGNCNELAHAACLAVAENPGRLYNPLVIFGSAGLGKTHLLSATGQHILRRLPGQRLVYISSEAFTNELIQAVRYDGVSTFRDKYRQVDGLLLDDIQFLAGRERTQEEFFHTFNALYETGKQIILTTDKMPRDIPGLEKRLQSRFEWGLMADLQPPDEETKVAILQKKASEQGVDLSREVCFYLSRLPEANVRVLEGCLTRVIAVSRFQGVEVSLELVKRVMGPMMTNREVSLEEVLSAVAGLYGVKVADIKGSRKTREVTHPRQVAMYLARRLTRNSYPEIGRAFGNKDHSTVVKGVKKIQKIIRQDPEVAERVRGLEQRLREGQDQAV